MAGPYNVADALNYLGIGKQSARGTAVAPTTFIPYLGDVTVAHGQEGETVMEGGVGPYVSRVVKTKHGPGGSFELAARPATAAKLIAWFLGADASAAAGSLYDHTATPTLAPTWLTVEVNQSDEITERFADCMLSKLKISGAEANGDVKIAVDWMGCTPAIGGSPTSETYETGLHGSTAGAPFRSGDGAFTIDGSAVSNVHSWTLELDWGIDGGIYLSKVTRDRLAKLQLTASLTVRQLELSDADYRRTNYGATGGTAAAANFARSTSSAWSAIYGNGLTSTNLRQLSVLCPDVVWKEAPRKISAGGATHYLERKGDVMASSVSIVSRTADASAY